MGIPLKQLTGVFAGFIRISAFTADGASDTVTSAITTALSTAGRGGVAVPLQASSGEDSVGVVVTGDNRVEIYDAATKQKVKDASGNEVYGRITHSGGVYTLTYYSLVSGTETAYTSFSSTSIDFEFLYRFDLYRLPSGFATGVKSRNVSDDPAGTGGTVYREQLTPTGTNALPDLTKTPTSSSVLLLYVNGVAIDSFGSGSAPFSLSGKTITWSATNAGFTLETTDRVIASYFTNE